MSANVSCPSIEDLHRLQCGRLPAAEVEVLARHLEACGQCAEALQSLAGEDSLVGILSGDDTAEDAPVDQLIGRLKGLLSGETTSTSARLAPVLAPPRGPGEIGRLGNYRVLEVLGSGGMGTVYQARDIRLPRLVALKTILTGPEACPERLSRFRREAEAVARLQHPNIVQLLEIGEHDGQPFLVMEYVSGGSLARRLAENVLPIRPTAVLIESLARALHAAHSVGIVHRDLKPANVLLAADGTPRLADFGLAKRLDEETAATQPGVVLGTPGYMAPEQMGGSGTEIGPAADIYGLGAVLYECLTGRPPFRAATPLETLDLVRGREPVPPRQLAGNVPADLETICLKCLRKEPGKRYASAVELADDLGRFLRGEPIRARPVSSLERLGKWVRRKPALAALAAVSVLSLVALVTGGLVYQARLREAVERADAKAAEAQRQKERVEAGYESAHDTLERILRRLEGRRMSEVPQLKELQRALLEDALAFYLAQLEGADDPDPAVRRDAALACRRAADIQQVMGQAEAAAANYRRVLALLSDLPQQMREAPENQTAQASCLNNLAVLAGRAGRENEAERHQRSALAIRERLARSHPDDPGMQNALAETVHNLGAIYYNTHRWADAEKACLRAVEIRAGLVRAHPREERYQAALAQDYLNLGRLYHTRSRLTEASAAYKKADALLRPLADRGPPAGTYTLSLVVLYYNWGYLLAGEKCSRESLARLDEAVRRAEAAHRHEPRHPEARERASQAHVARAEVHEYFGNLAGCVKDWDRAVKLAEGPARFNWRLTRARVLTSTADHVRATAEADELAKLPLARGVNLYSLARIYSLAIPPARADAGLAPSEREARAEDYGSRGVALLWKLHGEGYFKDPEHARSLRTDDGLRSLRDRDDFQQLLKQVEGKK
jgi:tetratricopeptide (TPR) repeat protein